MIRIATVVCAILAVFGFEAKSASAEFAPESLEFFERKIRPLLAERCYECHRAGSPKLKAGLALDSREGILKGGDSGPAVVPGDASKSLLIEAVGYDNVDLQMPPKGRLSGQQIADLKSWISMGAPWPKEAAGATAAASQEFDLPRRVKEHWAWQPVQPTKPPAVRDAAWPRSPVDHFILARLEAAGLSPAARADKRALIRRAAFDLTGLPPTPEQIEEFLADESPQAFARVVDQFLDSPRFGERWARHWLDLVRYSETMGHEFDYPIHNAWRYRDYIIRAFNQDLPYDQFVSEHIAGDLLQNPRTHEQTGYNESLTGTAFYWFAQQKHSPVDLRLEQADLIENQIDVLSKTFLGLTVACARCHDHKFDAISTKDFYSLYGVLESSRFTHAPIHPPERTREIIEELARLNLEIRNEIGRLAETELADFGRYFLAALRSIGKPGALPEPASVEEESAPNTPLDSAHLRRWVKALGEVAEKGAGHTMNAWLAVHRSAADQQSAQAPNSNDARQGPAVNPQFKVSEMQFADWMETGQAFGLTESMDFLVGESADRPIARIIRPGWMDSGLFSRRLQGILRSPSFTIDEPYVHALVSGRESRVSVVIENFTLIRAPIYGGLKKLVDREEPHWITFDLGMWKGNRAYLEFSDIALSDPADSLRPQGYGTNGFIAVNKVHFSKEKAPPAGFAGNMLPSPSSIHAGDLNSLASQFQKAANNAVQALVQSHPQTTGKLAADAELLEWLLKNGLIMAKSSKHLEKLVKSYKDIETSIPDPVYVPAMTEGTSMDERIFIRGNPKNLGPIAPRGFLEALAGNGRPPIQHGSGRLELARQITDPANPLMARVMVNRVWHHLFGRGIVGTVDDFGVLGDRPTHPELLDWLADWYRANGYSSKKLIRLLMLSQTYQMSSQSSDAMAEEKDSNNTLLHRANVRRLQGEAIRDAMLSVSGRLDTRMFGPPVPIHLTPFMEGRGRPGKSGPLDGDGRRSIYVEVRRNFLSPMMLAFDAPLPYTTIGRRTVSNVPAQALILMNDPFVIQQANHWADRLLSEESKSVEERIRAMYSKALGRLPGDAEVAGAKEFLEKQIRAYGAANDARKLAWADLCHVIFNLKEFVFLN